MLKGWVRKWLGVDTIEERMLSHMDINGVEHDSLHSDIVKINKSISEINHIINSMTARNISQEDNFRYIEALSEALGMEFKTIQIPDPCINIIPPTVSKMVCIKKAKK